MLINKMQNSNYNYSQPQHNAQTKSNAVSFTGKPPVENVDSKFFDNFKKPISKFYDARLEQIAGGIGKILDTKFSSTIINKTKRSKGLFNHLMTTGSVVLSSLYVIRTLTNKDLDEKKRKTLAINQGIVFGLSTAMCYTVESKMKASIDNFADKFEAYNYKRLMGDPKKLEILNKCVKGVGIAGKIMIFDSIYRFIAPVFVTPVANKLGNNINSKH